MLNISSTTGGSRRDFLRIGSLALGGLALPHLLSQWARGSTTPKLATDRAVVMLFLQGGPSQLEMFDPKMDAPQEIRSIFGEVKTRLPGVTFGATFPKLAALADRLAVIRSFSPGNADHQNYLTVAGGNSMKVPMGSLYARIAGSNAPGTGMPTNILVTPEAVGGPGFKIGKNFETSALEKLVAGSAGLGPTYAYFEPAGSGQMRQNLDLRQPRDLFDDRRGLLEQLDTFKRQVDKTGAFDTLSTHEQQAYEVIVNGIAQAFDLGREKPETLARYDTSKLFRLDEVQKWGDMRRSSNQLGKQMLMARRLVEAGCGFVTVMDAGWDMHSNGNSPKNLAGMNWLGGQVDHAVSAFLEDLHERGLSEKVLLIVTGEMGRTPKINKNGGRDHWAELGPLLLAGGGLKMGQVIGQSDRQGGKPATEKLTPANLLATVMQTQFDVGQLRVSREVPTNVLMATTTGKPIPDLF